MISRVFDTIVADPKDFSILRLLLSDLERQIGEPAQKMEECWDLWEPVLRTVRENIGEGPCKELERIRDEIGVALDQSSGRQLHAQQQFLKILITAAYRRTVPTAYRVRDCGPQAKTLDELEKELAMSASHVTTDALIWTFSVSGSVRDGAREFAKLARTTLHQYTIGTELGKGLQREFNTWLRRFCDTVCSHTDRMRTDIRCAHRAFKTQLESDKRFSDMKQYLPPIQIAYTRSVGVMLDASVRVRFARIVQSFKTLYMKTIEVNPCKVYDAPQEFVQNWSDVHHQFLGMLMLKDSFHIGVPTLEEVIESATHHRIASRDRDDASEGLDGYDPNIDWNNPWFRPKKPEAAPQDQSDNGFSEPVSIEPEETVPKVDEPSQELTPVLGNVSEDEKPKKKWFKRFAARTKKLFGKA